MVTNPQDFAMADNSIQTPQVQTYAAAKSRKPSVCLALLSSPIREDEEGRLTPYVRLTPDVARLVATDLIRAAAESEQMADAQ